MKEFNNEKSRKLYLETSWTDQHFITRRCISKESRRGRLSYPSPCSLWPERHHLVPFSTPPLSPECIFTVLGSKPQGVTVDQLARLLSVQTRRWCFRLPTSADTAPLEKSVQSYILRGTPLSTKCPVQDSRCGLPSPPWGPHLGGPAEALLRQGNIVIFCCIH